MSFSYAPTRLVGPLKSSPIQTRRQLFGTGGLSAGTNLTFSLVCAAESAFSAVRVIVYNPSTAGAITINNVGIAPSAKLNDGYSPVDASGNSIALTAVTFNNGGVDGNVPSPSGSATSISIPAATGSGNNITPGKVLSDWMPLASLARADGGVLPLLMTRLYALSNMPCSTGASLIAFDGTVDQGRVCRCFYKSGGNFATAANQAGFTAPTQYLTGPYIALQFIGGRGITVAGVGDSLKLGQYTTGWMNPAGHQACAALSTPSFPVMWANYGSGGQNTAYFLGRAIDIITTIRPDVLVIPTGSPNDGGAIGTPALLAQALDVADLCVRNSIVPILETTAPWNGSSGADAARVAMNATVRALAQGGMLINDNDAVLSDGGSPAALKSIYAYTDGTHWLDAGHAAVATRQWVPNLQRVIAARAA